MVWLFSGWRVALNLAPSATLSLAVSPVRAVSTTVFTVAFVAFVAVSCSDSVEPDSEQSLVMAVSVPTKSAEVGSALPDSVRVRVMTSDGRPVAGRRVELRLPWFIADDSSRVSPTFRLTDATGTASFEWTLGTSAHYYARNVIHYSSAGDTLHEEWVSAQALPGIPDRVASGFDSLFFFIGDTLTLDLHDRFGNLTPSGAQSVLRFSTDNPGVAAVHETTSRIVARQTGTTSLRIAGGFSDGKTLNIQVQPAIATWYPLALSSSVGVAGPRALTRIGSDLVLSRAANGVWEREPGAPTYGLSPVMSPNGVAWTMAMSGQVWRSPAQGAWEPVTLPWTPGSIRTAHDSAAVMFVTSGYWVAIGKPVRAIGGEQGSYYLISSDDLLRTRTTGDSIEVAHSSDGQVWRVTGKIPWTPTTGSHVVARPGRPEAIMTITRFAAGVVHYATYRLTTSDVIRTDSIPGIAVPDGLGNLVYFTASTIRWDSLMPTLQMTSRWSIFGRYSGSGQSVWVTASRLGSGAQALVRIERR